MVPKGATLHFAKASATDARPRSPLAGPRRRNAFPAATLHARDARGDADLVRLVGWLFSNGTTGPRQRSNHKPQKRLCALRQSRVAAAYEPCGSPMLRRSRARRLRSRRSCGFPPRTRRRLGRRSKADAEELPQLLHATRDLTGKGVQRGAPTHPWGAFTGEHSHGARNRSRNRAKATAPNHETIKTHRH